MAVHNEEDTTDVFHLYILPPTNAQRLLKILQETIPVLYFSQIEVTTHTKPMWPVQQPQQGYQTVGNRQYILKRIGGDIIPCSIKYPYFAGISDFSLCNWNCRETQTTFFFCMWLQHKPLRFEKSNGFYCFQAAKIIKSENIVEGSNFAQVTNFRPFFKL